MKKNILFLISLFPFFVMCQNSNEKEETPSVVPSDTIPMQYSLLYNDLRLPILEGIVNDSLHLKVLFDTGAAANRFSILDSFKNFFDSDSAFVQIGKFKKQVRISYLRSDQKNFTDLNALGKNSILLDWTFFENQIIEFDLQNQRILVYNELPNVANYSKIKMELSPGSKLIIPAQVVIHGKTIESNFIIDTGFNGFLMLSTKHIEKQEIDTIGASYGKLTASVGLLPVCGVPADTIKIGDLYMADQDMFISFRNLEDVSGLLGTQTLQNFSVILDLINFDLYLKKIEK